VPCYPSTMGTERTTRLILVAAMLSLTACGSVTRVVVLENPQTKQTVECRVDPWGDIRRTRQIEDYVDAYRMAGYAVIGDTEKK